MTQDETLSAALDALAAERQRAERAERQRDAAHAELHDIEPCGHERRYTEKSQWPECMQCRAERAEAERNEALEANASVAVCAGHTAEAVYTDEVPCLVCALGKAEAERDRLAGEVERLKGLLGRCDNALDHAGFLPATVLRMDIRAALSPKGGGQ